MKLFYTLIENVAHGSRFEDKKNIIISLFIIAQKYHIDNIFNGFSMCTFYEQIFAIMNFQMLNILKRKYHKFNKCLTGNYLICKKLY